jgi:3-phosphoglycerate kinase
MCKIISGAKTVIWNGTLGYAELPQYALSSMAVANTLAKNPDIMSVIGGGDTADFVLHWDNKKVVVLGMFLHCGGLSGANVRVAMPELTVIKALNRAFVSLSPSNFDHAVSAA